MSKSYYSSLKVEHRKLLEERWDRELNSIKIEEILYTGEAHWRWEGCEHSYLSTAGQELSRKRCPICTGKFLSVGVNDLTTLREDLARQYSIKNKESIDMLTKSSTYVAIWECEKEGHSWEQEVRKRWRAKSVCPICDTLIIVPGVNDFLTRNPQLVDSWDFTKNSIDPYTLKSTYIPPVWWICEKGHSWQVSVLSRVKADKGCRVCAGRDLLSGVNDFATIHPDKLLIWRIAPSNPNPSTVLYNTDKVEVIWECEKGHNYTTTPSTINRGRGCPYCGGSRVWEGFNDLAYKEPESLVWWDYRKNEGSPKSISFASHKKVWWVCPPEGHSYDMSCYKFYDGKRCPYCAGKRVDSTNSIASNFPELMKDWDYERNTVSPHEITRGYGTNVSWKCFTCGHLWDTFPYNRTKVDSPHGCPKCARGATTSRGEREIFEFLQASGVKNLVSNKRFVNKSGKVFEIDLFMPEFNIGIEFNGVYYHSEKFVNKDYHKEKWLSCQERGIQLLQIWEDDWNSKSEILKNLMLHKLHLSKELSVYARKTVISEISNKEAFQFLNENHIQGSANASLYFALTFDEKIVSVLSIRRENQGKTFNIIRYATNRRVVGGFTKMLSYVERNYVFDEWVTFSDNCVSNGSLYSSNGFLKDKDLPSDYSYLVKNVRKHKFGFRLVKFRNSPELIFEEGKTEHELAQMNNLLRIYDAGKIRWVKPHPSFRLS